jgi:hypothetical protein
VRRVRDVIERLLRDGTVVASSDGTLHTVFPVAASPAEGEALRTWIVREGATRTIEIGLGYGVSALFACDGLLANGGTEARHVVLDPHQATRFAGCGLQLLEEAGVAELVEHPRRSRRRRCRGSSPRAGRSTWPSSTATTGSTASSSTSSTSGASSAPAGSRSTTTNSSRRSRGRRRSA